MKTVKILSAILALIMALSMFVACNTTPDDDPDASGEGPQSTRPRHKVTAHFKVVNYDGKVLYETDEDEPYEYDSAYYEPTFFNFVDDYSFMNDKEFTYKLNSSKLFDSVTITQRKKTNTYKAGETVTLKDKNGNPYEAKTIWVCYVNDKAVDNMNETVIQPGDIVELRLEGVKIG